jgi:hypothetical protein
MAKSKPEPRNAGSIRRRQAGYLRKIQKELMPEHAREFLAINLYTGEYILAKSADQASALFIARWPDAPVELCRVDGGPAAKFYGM